MENLGYKRADECSYAAVTKNHTAKILELLKNPETAALLKQIVSAL